jgi:hypothetical protein
MIRTSICVHCAKLIESDTSTSLMLNEAYWRHISSGLGNCSWPIELDCIYESWAKPICMDMFSPVDGKFCDWIGN